MNITPQAAHCQNAMQHSAVSQEENDRYPTILCVYNYISKITCDVISLSRVRYSELETCFVSKCSAWRITRLIYIHCVSKEVFSVHLKGSSCAVLCCKEIHWSYAESMSKRRFSLVPKFIEDRPVEELFASLWSPVLIRINCSCDITVSISFLFTKNDSNSSVNPEMNEYLCIRVGFCSLGFYTDV